MAEFEILRGKVLSYPGEKDKGLAEVAIGAYDGDGGTVYARVEQSMSGVYWLPEIGDAVEVELPTRPGGEPRIVHVHRPGEDGQTGACWTEKNDLKQVRTRSGHCITLDDAEGHTAVTVRTAGGLELRLEDEGQTVTLCAEGKEAPALRLDVKNDAVTLTAGKELTLSCGGASVTLDREGNVTVKAKGTLELSGRDVSAGATGRLKAKGQTAELTAAAGAKVDGGSKLELTAAGVTQVKGGMVKLN